MGANMQDELPDRYDRQVRLWGEHGQRSIGQTNVAVIGSSALATEILKSLILAGIGSYKIFDDELVQESDTGNNFFVTRDDLHKNRAETVTKLLNELNPSVRGSFAARSFNTSSALSALNEFSLVVGVRVQLDVAEYIADYLFERNIPFVWTTSVGFVGYFRLSYREHEVLHDHKEASPHDFRLHAPFPAFKQFVDQLDLENMKHEQHSHIPFVVLLSKALDAWREEIGEPEALPTSYRMRKEFVALLMEMQKLNDQGIYNEENFAEAKQHLIRSFSGIEASENVKRLFDDPRSTANSSNDQVSNFWVYVSAVKQFYKQHGYLPLSGSLPDMTSDTVSYTNLVKLFREQARTEAEEVHKNVTELMKLPKFEGIDVSFSETVNYCKNFSRLNAITGTNLADEFKNGIRPVFSKISQYLEEHGLTNGGISEDGDHAISNDVCPLVWLVVLRAAEYFAKSKNRYPGTNGVPCTIDSKDLLDRVKMLLEETKDPQLIAKFENLVPARAVEEICRYGNSELNITASILGGVIAQEIIKLCTQQYVPVDNTFIFDGNTQVSASIRL